MDEEPSPGGSRFLLGVVSGAALVWAIFGRKFEVPGPWSPEREVALPRGDVPARSAAELNAQELEVLARMEHDRWWAERALDGWQYGPERDNACKLHPNMVPYEQLAEKIRQLDRDNVQQVLQLALGDDRVLAMAGPEHRSTAG